MNCVYSRCILKYLNTWWNFLCFLIISLQQNLRTKDISGLDRKHTSALTKICSHCAPSKYCIKTPYNRISFLRPFVDCQYLSAEILKAGYYRVDITWHSADVWSGIGTEYQRSVHMLNRYYLRAVFCKYWYGLNVKSNVYLACLAQW